MIHYGPNLIRNIPAVANDGGLVENGKSNGAADEAGDDADTPWTPELYRELIKASRERQGKPAQLTGEEWLLPLDGCELLLRREREAEYAIYKAKAHEEEIKKFRLSLRIDLIMVVGGVGLWLLSRVDGLPWILEAILVSADDKSSRGHLWIFIATLGLGGGILSFFELRALRLETDRPRKQANAVWTTAKWLLIAAGVIFFGAILFVLGLVVRDSLNGGFERPPYIIMSFLVILLLKVPIFLWVFDWIEFRASRAGLACLLVLFALLVAAHVFSVLDFVWLLRENAPLWSMLLLISFGTALAWPLFWVIAAAACRMRVLYAEADEGRSNVFPNQ